MKVIPNENETTDTDTAAAAVQLLLLQLPWFYFCLDSRVTRCSSSSSRAAASVRIWFLISLQLRTTAAPSTDSAPPNNCHPRTMNSFTATMNNETSGMLWNAFWPSTAPSEPTNQGMSTLTVILQENRESINFLAVGIKLHINSCQFYQPSMAKNCNHFENLL